MTMYPSSSVNPQVSKGERKPYFFQRSSGVHRKKAYLPTDYRPSNRDVICKKGLKGFSHQGNERFRQVIDDRVDKYNNAKTKIEKSVVVNDILEMYRDSLVYFVRQDEQGRWFEIGDDAAREKIGQSIREAVIRRDPEKMRNKRERRAAQKARRDQAKATAGSVKKKDQTTAPTTASNQGDAAGGRPLMQEKDGQGRHDQPNHILAHAGLLTRGTLQSSFPTYQPMTPVSQWRTTSAGHQHAINYHHYHPESVSSSINYSLLHHHHNHHQNQDERIRYEHSIMSGFVPPSMPSRTQNTSRDWCDKIEPIAPDDDHVLRQAMMPGRRTNVWSYQQEGVGTDDLLFALNNASKELEKHKK